MKDWTNHNKINNMYLENWNFHFTPTKYESNVISLASSSNLDGFFHLACCNALQDCILIEGYATWNAT